MLQAIEYGSKLNEEQYHYGELGVSTLSSIMVNINRDPKSKPAEPHDFQYFMREQRSLFDSTVCDCFDSVARDRLFPDWVLETIPDPITEQLLKNRRFNPVRGVRLLLGESIALFAPQIRGDRVTIPLGVMGAIENGIYEVKDVDTGAEWLIFVEMPQGSEGQPQAFVDHSFEISKNERMEQ